jgi:hypothetical protein
MEKSLGKEYPITQRLTYLKANCDSVLELGYMKRLSPDEIKENKDLLSETAIQINDIEIEKKEVAVEFKQRLDPLISQRTEILKALKQKAIFIKEECYKYVDVEEKVVGFYNSEGDLIEFRPAYPDELQGTIFQMGRKTGTNN